MPDFPQRWDRYVLVRPLGSGGMGSVYLALTRSGGKEALCVVKRLTAEALSDPIRRKRFWREGDISRTLSFSGIARTLDAKEYAGEPYLAQEYVEGRTVAQLCSAAASVGKRLSPLMIAYIGERVATALGYAHRIGVVHRDIAPSNVMIRFDGEVSLIDFGIARRSDDLSLTSTGEFVGRAAYTAPEVFDGGDADARSDIYSVGVLLWEVLAGRSPLFQELKSQPAPSKVALDAAIPPELDVLVTRALAPDPADRFQRAEDLAAALLEVTRYGDGKKEITSLIATAYDVALEHQRLTVDLVEARALLAGTAREEAEPGTRPSRGRFRRRLWIYAVLAAGSVVLVGFELRSRPETSTASARLPLPKSPAQKPLLPATTASKPAPTAPALVPPKPGAPAITEHVSHAKPRQRAARAPLLRDPSPASSAVSSLDRARAGLRDGRFDEATRYAGEALQAGTPQQKAAAHVILGEVLLFQAKRRLAADEFAAAIQLDPENSSASDQLAALRRRGGQ